MILKAAQFPGGFVPDAGIIESWIRHYTVYEERLQGITADEDQAVITFDPDLTDDERGIVVSAIATSAYRDRPQTSDRKEIQRASAYAIGTRLYIAGRCDDRSAGTGKGQQFKLEASAEGLSSWVEWKFNDWVELGGGGMWYKGAEFGDYTTFKLVAPATAITPTPGTGNCNLHASGILIPAANGDYTVDLETSDAFVPILQKNGYWNWSYPNTGIGTCEAAPDGDGNCQLVPADVDVHTYVADVGMLGDGYLNVTFPGIDPTRIPPQWKMCCRVNNCDGTHTLQLVWELEVGRMNGAVSYS